jgi:hypothetical protein
MKIRDFRKELEYDNAMDGMEPNHETRMTTRLESIISLLNVEMVCLMNRNACCVC